MKELEKVLTGVILAGIVVGVGIYYKEVVEGELKALAAGATEFINGLRS